MRAEKTRNELEKRTKLYFLRKKEEPNTKQRSEQKATIKQQYGKQDDNNSKVWKQYDDYSQV